MPGLIRLARLLRRTRGPSILLGSGLALCVTAFAIGDTLLRNGLPFPDPATLLWIGVESPRDASLGISFSQHDALVREVNELTSESPYLLGSGAIATTEGAEGISLARVGGSFFDVLRAQPVAGRLLTPSDDHAGAERVVVISDSLWRRLLGADPAAVGRVLQIDDVDYRVAGVVARDRSFPAGTDAWVSLEATAGLVLRSSDAPFLLAVARLRNRDALTTAQAGLRTRWTVKPTDVESRFVVELLAEHLVKGRRVAIVLFGAASAFLMAIAVLGAVTMQLAALTERERDVAIRSALGASHAQLSRMAIREAAAIMLGATVLGLALSNLLLGVGRSFGSLVLPDLAFVHFSPAVFLAALTFAGLTAAVVATVPIATLARSTASGLLHLGSYTLTTAQPKARLRDTLVGIAMGLSLVLVIGAVTSASTVLRLERVETGFTTHGVWASEVRLPMQVVTPPESERIRVFITAFSAALASASNRATIAVSTDMPGSGNQSIVAISAARQPADAQIQVGMSQVSGQFFSTLRIPILRGRGFRAEDRSGGARVVIVDDEVARALYGGAQAVGQRMDIASLGVSAEIIGIAGAVRQRGRFGERLPQIYLPIEQLLALPRMTFLIEASDGRVPLPPHEYQRLLHTTYPSATASALAPLESRLAAELRPPQFYSMALTIFAAVAVLVAAGAVHASVAALVARRTRELGLRVALGARTSRIVRLVLARVGVSVLAGSGLGAFAGLALLRVLEARIVLERPSPLVFGLSVVILWAAATLAVLRPIVRATRVSPMLALQSSSGHFG